MSIYGIKVGDCHRISLYNGIQNGCATIYPYLITRLKNVSKILLKIKAVLRGLDKRYESEFQYFVV